MPAMLAMHLRRAQPCRRRLCRRAPSRTHALSHAALPLPLLRSWLACMRRITHAASGTQPSAPHHPAPSWFGREISDSLLDFNTTSTTKVCASSQRHATWPTGPRPLPLSHLDRPSPLAPCSSPISIFPTPSPHSSLLAPSPSALAGFPCSLVYISPNLASKCGGEGVTA